jgi:putative phosphoribosyl transferase
MIFKDRADAGRKLAARLTRYADREDVLVLALPRGGVPVAYEVAKALNAPLDVFLVRKLGVPGHEELAMGAIATGGVRVVNESGGIGTMSKALSNVAALHLSGSTGVAKLYCRGIPAPDVFDHP